MESLYSSYSSEHSPCKASAEAAGAEPDHAWTLHLLKVVTIRSFLPGRIRFAIGFPGGEAVGDTIRREIQKVNGVRLHSYSERTRTALVTYDPKATSALIVTQALLRGVLEYGRLHGECGIEHHHHDALVSEHGHDHGDGHCDHDHSALATDAGIRKELLKLVLTGGVLGYFLVRKVRNQPPLFPGNPLLDIAGVVTVLSGFSIFRSGFGTVQKRQKPTDDTLISIAVSATLLMGESLTGLSVVWLINLGRLLEAVTLKRSRTAIKELMDITPPEAWCLDSAKPSAAPKLTAVEKIAKGQRIRVFAGEKVPLDGKVYAGEAFVKEAFITGEALPVLKNAGTTVYAGSLLENGDLDIEVTSLVHDTVVARIIHAIENIRDTKAPIEKIGTRFASQFVPISLGLFGVTLFFTGDLRRAITMLVIACPCAAGLATPTAVSASIGQAARHGILIKGGTHIEVASRIDTIIFDKTGTLTRGSHELLEFRASPDGLRWGADECLRIAASSEQHAAHPLARALVAAARKRNLELSAVDKFQLRPGLGVEASVEGRAIHVGNSRFLQSAGVDVPAGQPTSGTVLHFAIDRSFLGSFIVEDAMQPDAERMFGRLREMGIRRLIIATGDSWEAGQKVASLLGDVELHAELLPEDKLALVSELKAQGCRVAMVGDGVNDAQALARADLSIALGAGRCDVAMESADVTLARNDLMLVPRCLEISDKTLRTIYQNFVASVGINVVGLGFSMFGKLTPFSAAIVHNASTIAVVLNSLRLGREVGEGNPLEVIREHFEG